MTDADHHVPGDRDDLAERPGDSTGIPPDGVGEGPLKTSSDRYPGDSEDYRHAGSVTDPGTGTSDGYLPDSDGYSDSAVSPYASPPPERVRDRMDPRSGWLCEFDFVKDGIPPRKEPMERQVNVRLDRDKYRDLCEAADLYGVAPTTMARMLVRRGTRAVLDERRRDDWLHGGPD